MTTAFVRAATARANPSGLRSGICSLIPLKLRSGKVGKVHATYCTPLTMTATTTSYDKLTDLCREISSLTEIRGILHWDKEVVMPSGGAGIRGKQVAALAAVLHEKRTSAELRDAISMAKEDVSSLGAFEQAVVRDADRDYKHKVGVPKELEMEIAEHEVISTQVWLKAREENDFKSFAPYLAKLVDLTKKYAVATRPETAPYDGAIDVYERGMSASRLTELFSEIVGPLKELTTQIIAARANLPDIHEALKGGDLWTVEKQTDLCKEVAKVLGFDYNRGRIGTSEVYTMCSYRLG